MSDILLAGTDSGGGSGPAFDQNRPLDITLIGPDGTDEQTLVFNDPDSPFRLMLDVGGLGLPTWTAPTTRSPGRAGTRLRPFGVSADPRDFLLPIRVKTTSGQLWLQHNRRLWKCFDPVRQSRLVIKDPYGNATKTLLIRFVDDGGGSFEHDPVQTKTYPIRVVADMPFYQGDTVTRSFARTAPQDFLTPGGGKWISRSRQLGNASISNLGDEPAFYTAVITGTDEDGVLTWSVGIDGKTVGGPIEVPVGDTITVNTAPGRMSVRRADGTSVVADLTSSAFTAVAPGEQVPMQFAMTGYGSIKVSLTPLYRQPL